mmetsp:Transcript_18357/g.37402  ORF Transcript_18357/g.37402 Transcript_18357/m.37402 type:complete len:201 (+) Transcript_18357:198-800(+)
MHRYTRPLTSSPPSRICALLRAPSSASASGTSGQVRSTTKYTSRCCRSSSGSSSSTSPSSCSASPPPCLGTPTPLRRWAHGSLRSAGGSCTRWCRSGTPSTFESTTSSPRWALVSSTPVASGMTRYRRKRITRSSGTSAPLRDPSIRPRRLRRCTTDAAARALPRAGSSSRTSSSRNLRSPCPRGCLFGSSQRARRQWSE